MIHRASVRAVAPWLMVAALAGTSNGTGRAAAAPASFTDTARGLHYPDDRAALPVAQLTFPGLSDATGPESSGPYGPHRRARSWTAGSTAGSVSAAGAEGIRARMFENRQLGLAAALLRARVGFASFHCDTPPPSHA